MKPRRGLLSVESNVFVETFENAWWDCKILILLADWHLLLEIPNSIPVVPIHFRRQSSIYGIHFVPKIRSPSGIKHLRSLSITNERLRNDELLVCTESHILCPLSVQLEANIWLSGSVREFASSFQGQLLCHCSDVVGLKAAAPSYVPDAHVVRLAGVFGRVPPGHVSGLHGWNGLQWKSLREDPFLRK